MKKLSFFLFTISLVIGAERVMFGTDYPVCLPLLMKKFWEHTNHFLQIYAKPNEISF